MMIARRVAGHRGTLCPGVPASSRLALPFKESIPPDPTRPLGHVRRALAADGYVRRCVTETRATARSIGRSCQALLRRSGGAPTQRGGRQVEETDFEDSPRWAQGLKLRLLPAALAGGRGQ